MIDKNIKIFFAIPQRREKNAVCAKPVVEVLAKEFFLLQLPEVDMG